MTSGAAIYQVMNRGESGKDYLVRDFNRAALAIERKTKAEVIGKTILDLRPNVDRFGLIPILHRVWTTGVAEKFAISRYQDDRYDGYYENQVFRLDSGEIVAIYDDVTERVNLAEQVKESEQRFKVLHNASFGGIALHDHGIILDCNQGFSDITGYAMDELIGMDGLLLIAPEDRELVMNHIKSQFEKPYEVDGIRKNKERYPLRLEAKSIPYKGKTIRVVEFKDITEMRRVQDQLRDTMEQHQLVLDSTASGIYAIDMKGNCTYINNNAKLLLGYQDETSVLGKNIHDLVHHSHEDGTPCRKTDCVLQKHIFSETLTNIDDIIWRKDGTFFPVSYSSAPQVKNGVVVGAVVTFSDISIRKQLENERLNREKQLLQTQKNLLESQRIAHLGTWRLDLLTNEVVWTEELYRMYGFDPTVPPPPYTEHMKLFTPESWNLLSASLARTRTEGIPYELELETVTKSGSNGWMWVRGEAEKNAQGEILAIWGAAQDVTDRIATQRKYQDSEARFVSLFQKAPVGYQSLDINGCFREVNQTWLDMLGYRYEDVIGRWFGDFLTPKYKDAFRQRFELFKKLGKIHSEFEMVKNNGEVVFIEFEGLIGYKENRQFQQTYCTLNDITERKRIEDLLIKSERRLDLAMAVKNEGIWDWDLETNLVEFDDRYYTMAGYRPGEFPGTLEEFQSRIHPQDVGMVMSTAEDYLSGKQSDFHVEFRFMCKDQTWIWIQGKGKIFEYTENGKPKRFIGTHTDITERKKLEFKIFEERNYLKYTLNSIGDAVIATDAGGIITGMNPIATRLTGWSEREATGRPFDEVFRITFEDPSKTIVDPVKTALLTNNVVELANHTILTSKDKTEYFIEDTASPIRNNENQIVGVVLVFRDVTEKKQRQREFQYQSEHDFLTGLYNRRYFVESYQTLNTPGHFPLGIVMFDVNGLKIINDAYGHDAGDLALKTVAAVLKQTFEAKDVVTRIGGDEFAVLLPNTSLKTMQEHKDALRLGMADHPIKNVVLSIATGYEITSDSNRTLDDMLKTAENHMYRHKLAEGVSVRNRAIQAIQNTLTEKYDAERIHSERVSAYSRRIGEALQLNPDDLKELSMAGMFHDIGKISIPDAIIEKPGRLTDEEFDIVKTHTEIGYQILRAADEFSDLAIHALCHHERWDGKGYPRGLKGEDIPLYSRIVGVADAFEAMTADRSYKQTMTIEQAKEELIRCSGTQFDPAIVAIFTEIVSSNRD